MRIAGARCLVTGGAGFIGSHLVDRLQEMGASQVVVVDNFFLGKEENLHGAWKRSGLEVYREDATDYFALEAIVEKERPEIVFNLATKALGYSFVNPEDAYIVNVLIARNLLHLLRRERYSHLVHYSSSEAYGTAQSVPITEDHPLKPHTPYAAGKAAADLMVVSFQAFLDCDIRIIRPFNTYGPRQNDGSYAAVIPLTIKRILNGQPPILQGDGLQTRDFLYVGDVVEGTVRLAESEAARGQIVNLASGYETSIGELISIIARLMDFEGGIRREPERPGDVRRLVGSIERAKKLVGFTPQVAFEEGLAVTIQWFARNHREPAAKVWRRRD